MMSEAPIHPPCAQGRVIWITGLSGAGKSTLAREVVARLKEAGEHVAWLDGDALRAVFGVSAFDGAQLDRAGRLQLALRYGRLSHLLASQGMIVVVSTISMFHEVHAWNRANLPGYFEAYLKVPMEELRRRDSKGIYGRFDAGEATHVAGMDLPVDEPRAPDWLMDAEKIAAVEDLAADLLANFRKKGRS